MTLQHASTHVAFSFLGHDSLFLTGVAGLILGMDQGRFVQEMPRVEPAPGRISS